MTDKEITFLARLTAKAAKLKWTPVPDMYRAYSAKFRPYWYSLPVKVIVTPNKLHVDGKIVATGSTLLYGIVKETKEGAKE